MFDWKKEDSDDVIFPLKQVHKFMYLLKNRYLSGCQVQIAFILLGEMKWYKKTPVKIRKKTMMTMTMNKMQKMEKIVTEMLKKDQKHYLMMLRIKKTKDPYLFMGNISLLLENQVH